MGLKEHRHAAPSSVNMAIITLSDTRSADEDTTGQMIHELLIEAGHRVTGPTVVPEDRSDMERALETALEDEKVQAVILNGGTRVAARDITPEVVRPYLDKELPGFGELFRLLSFQDIGSAALLSRSLAGISRQKVIFVLPGSRNACHLAMEQLILPELGHLVGEATKEGAGSEHHHHSHHHSHQHGDGSDHHHAKHEEGTSR